VGRNGVKVAKFATARHPPLGNLRPAGLGSGFGRARGWQCSVDGAGERIRAGARLAMFGGLGWGAVAGRRAGSKIGFRWAGGLREIGGDERIQAAGGGNWRSSAGRAEREAPASAVPSREREEATPRNPSRARQ
jgi:hypothetical protein